MDSVDRHHAALAQAAERGNHYIAAGRESHSAVEFNRRFVGLGANPFCPHRLRQLAMRFAARRDIDLALPRVQDFNRQVRRRAEAEQSDALARLHFSHAQAAKADDPRAQQRRGSQIIKRVRQRKHEVGARGSVFGVAAVHGVSGERGRVAEVFFVMAAVPAGAIRAADPRHANARTQRQFRRCSADDFADNLVAGNQTASGGSAVHLP